MVFSTISISERQIIFSISILRIELQSLIVKLNRLVKFFQILMCISQQQISTTLQAAQQHKAATSARRITDTVKRADEEQCIKESVDRENLWAMETPQIFSKDLLLDAYLKVEQAQNVVTDEVSALELIGIRTYLVPNSTPNLKITFPEDLALAELLHTASE
mgnify:CR=1 FL=1